MESERGIAARCLAVAARLFIVRINEEGVVRDARGVLEIGPGASPDEVASVACRRMLFERGIDDERAVAALAKHFGFSYVGLPTSTAAE